MQNFSYNDFLKCNSFYFLLEFGAGVSTIFLHFGAIKGFLHLSTKLAKLGTRGMGTHYPSVQL